MSDEIDVDSITVEAEVYMEEAVNALERDLASYRTGRASPRLLDRLRVEMYGVESPINQLATVSVPEPRQLLIRPFDPSGISAIERAILKSDLGLTPNNDGKNIRLNIPPLTEERRRTLSRQVGQRVEDAKVSIRNHRRDARDSIKKAKDQSLITEDDQEYLEEQIQDLTNKFSEQVDKIGKEKADEVMEI